MKKLLKGESQFEIRERKKTFWIYDKKRGSYPLTWPEYGGKIGQGLATKEEAEAEVERLNELVGIKPAAEEKKPEPKKKAKAEKLDQEEPLPELPDYGVMSEDERKKYEEGLIDKGVY